MAVPIQEFRIGMPMTPDEFRIGKLYTVGEASKQNTGGGEGVEILVNEEFDGKDMSCHGQTFTKGQYTHKVFHLANKVPKVIRMLAPKGSLEIHEKSWNYYPYCKTIISNPDYMKDGFHITIESFLVENNRGDIPNLFQLEGERHAKREVVYLDIVNDSISKLDYRPEYDPSLFQSTKGNRGPFQGPDWQEGASPVMCVYKLVEAEFKWFGLQTTVESRIMKALTRLFRNFHRQALCCMDEYYGMSLGDIRKYEEEVKVELDKMRKTGSVIGMSEA